MSSRPTASRCRHLSKPRVIPAQRRPCSRRRSSNRASPLSTSTNLAAHSARQAADAFGSSAVSRLPWSSRRSFTSTRTYVRKLLMSGYGRFKPQHLGPRRSTASHNSAVGELKCARPFPPPSCALWHTYPSRLAAIMPANAYQEEGPSEGSAHFRSCRSAGQHPSLADGEPVDRNASGAGREAQEDQQASGAIRGTH